MTQEELDALMSEDVNLDEITDGAEANNEPAVEAGEEAVAEEKMETDADADNYRVSADHHWPPPPPTDDHKVVNQLDDVTRDSEVKATQIFDKLEGLSNEMMNIEGDANEIKEALNTQKQLMETLSQKFPNIDAFKTGIENMTNAEEKLENIINSSLSAGDEVMMAMDIMQYQDIHRQKIERVINVMRALSRYMNSLFEGKVDDTKRVSSATHIDGDTTTENVVSDDDIEALIASLGKQ